MLKNCFSYGSNWFSSHFFCWSVGKFEEFTSSNVYLWSKLEEWYVWNQSLTGNSFVTESKPIIMFAKESTNMVSWDPNNPHSINFPAFAKSWIRPDNPFLYPAMLFSLLMGLLNMIDCSMKNCHCFEEEFWEKHLVTLDGSCFLDFVA